MNYKENKYKKIAIIGNPGSEKSTLALKLYKITVIPLYHIDQYFWQSGWQKIDPATFKKTHKELCSKDSWIIEGMATKFFEERIAAADIVIFLNFSTWRCFYRVFKRAFNHFGTVYFASAPGCVERFPRFEFLKYILTFNQERKPLIEALLEKYKNKKRIIIIKNQYQLNTSIKDVFNIVS